MHISIIYREYPHSSAAVKVRQDLLRLVEDNPQGITCLDPMKDLKVNTMEYMELKDEKYRLEKTMCYYDCVRCPDFDDHVSKMFYFQVCVIIIT